MGVSRGGPHRRHGGPWRVKRTFQSQAAMPIKSVPDRTRRLIEAFDELCRAGWWPRHLAFNSTCPKYVHILRTQDTEDEYYRELLHRARNPQTNESPDRNGKL